MFLINFDFKLVDSLIGQLKHMDTVAGKEIYDVAERHDCVM